jgi:hypothetical protein
MDELTDEQKAANYMFLLETIDFLNGMEEMMGVNMSEWGVKQIQFIQNIYTCFELQDGLENVNSEIEDFEFRNRAKNASICIQQLMRSIQAMGTFDISTYEVFLHCIKFLVEFTMSEESIDECIALFNKGKMIS